jgi:hypothetical protein
MELLLLIGLLLLIFGCCQPTKPNPNPELICPHCNVKGKIETQSVRQKKGISGAKATGAIFTCGLSMLATGLSRKEDMTKAHCNNCDSVWYY